MNSVSSFADQVGQPMNVVPFGEITRWDDDGRDCGVIWEDARDIFRVVVVFADDVTPPGALRLQYWQSVWPHRRIPRDQPSGAGGSGWLDVGDWFQGEWKDADATIEVKGNAYTFTLNPLKAKEFPEIEDFDALYRTTLKLRLLADAVLPDIASFKAYTDSVCRLLDVEIEWGGTAKQSQAWDGCLEVFNGRTVGVDPLSKASAVVVKPDRSWQSTVKGKTDGISAKLLYAETKAYSSFDETVVTVRTAHETFSFAASDLIEWGHIFIPDYGVLVRKAGVDVTYASAEKACRESKEKDLYSRVRDLEEQTLTRAWNDTPEKGHHLIPLSFEGGRQHFGLTESGRVFCIKNWLNRVPDTNTKRCTWEADEILYRFGLQGAQLAERTRVDGCLPMAVTTWERDGVRYRQTAFVVPLGGVPKPGERILAEDPLICMMRFEMERAGEEDSEAALSIGVQSAGKDRKVGVENGWVVEKAEKAGYRRMVVTSPDKGASYSMSESESGDRIEYRAALTNDDPSSTLEFAIPFITMKLGEELRQVESLRFDDAYEAVRDYWRGRVATSTQIQTPEPMVNDFYKAHVAHLLINTEREVGGADRYMARVGTFQYGVFGNESCMMVSDLDRRGFHERAEHALETWLHYQGTVELPGDYSTKEGVLYGAGGYEDGGYNQHHGWILWCLGEHYWYTRDDAWLKRAAPHVVKACDWIINERKRTGEIAAHSPIRAIERGLLPPGRLEDIGDWRSWLSTNTYSWWGMQNAAAALAAAKHPDAKRLLDEAAAYRKDLLRVFTDAMQRSPVVRLRDGTWIPHVPAEVHRRGRTHGWITETLEGAIHLVRCGALEPWDRRSTWIIRDYEDNLYLSEQFGYNLTGDEFKRRWFSHGGISQQANLLCNPIPYLLRDEPKHFLRAYFNAFAVSYFPDTRMMTEHALPNIGDWAGDHFKSSDEANSTYWLRLMFVMERGDELWLGAAIPRYWLRHGERMDIENTTTYFGPMSMALESRVAQGEIEMTVEPPRRNPPRVIRACFRHPESEKMIACEVNGKRYANFNSDEEWVELRDCTKSTAIVAFYR